jgi:putative membrane protein
MDRRVVLTGIAAVAVAPAALAQQAQPVTPQSTAPQSGGAAGGTYSQAAQGGQAAMGQAEMQHLQQTMMGGAFALQTSEIALQKAKDEDVKQFAQFEVDEQRTIAEVLRSMMEPSGTASGASAAAPQLDAKHAEMVKKLQQAQAGEAFDKMYVDGQLQGHEELLQIQETYLKSNSRNREHVNVAKLARGHIKEHVQVLTDLKEAL